MSVKILSVFGTRPEAIKMAPLILELQKNEDLESLVCVTGQHREMLDAVLPVFGITPEWDLNIMREKQTLAYITAAVVEKLSQVLLQCKPDLLLVHGDTTTSFAAALAGFYRQIPVGHVEAGLRSLCKYAPFPEEINRTLTGHIAHLHFAPTEENRKNLLRENITEGIFVTGNTVIDAMKYTVQKHYLFENAFLNTLDLQGHKTLLLTAHRRENWGAALQSICNAARDIANRFSTVQIIFPVHKNPLVRALTDKVLGGIPNVHLLEPLSVLDMHNLMARSYAVLTDSGGLQEEAPALHKPVLVLRSETERPEVIQCGGAYLVGVQQEEIVRMTARLLTEDSLYQSMKSAINPYGDGTACAKIAAHIRTWAQDRSGYSCPIQ